jgi:hypothetical protein
VNYSRATCCTTSQHPSEQPLHSAGKRYSLATTYSGCAEPRKAASPAGLHIGNSVAFDSLILWWRG